MKKIITLFILSFLLKNVSASEFITRWDMNYFNLGGASISPTMLEFGVETTGTVNYTWETLPAGTTGSGTFSGTTATITGIPAGSIIRLKIDSANFKSINMINSLYDIRLVNIEQWGTINWSTMHYAFNGCNNLNISANDIPNLTNVTNLSCCFRSCSSLNGPTNINSWDVSNVIDMDSMFCYATSFNQPIGNWNTSNVKNMSSMFSNANTFNQPIGNWNTGNVTNMNSMFAEAISFNQPLGSWNTSNVVDMSFMFFYTSTFNQPLNNWNTGNVTNMLGMFSYVMAFNQPIGNWNTNNVTDMNSMFYYASAFNQPIDNWNTSNVADMSFMFYLASTFNQTIGSWQLNPNANIEAMLGFSGIDCNNYYSILNGWANNVNTPSTKNIGSYGLHYGTNAVISRNYLINIKGWTITGDTMSNTTCFPTDISTIGETNQITISPNPANSIFKIECPMNEGNVILYNSFGQKLLTSKIENQTSLIDISHFSKGIYIAEIIDDKTSYRVKIVKE